MNVLELIRFVALALACGAAGWLFSAYREATAYAKGYRDNAEVALDILQQIEYSRDPGREIHERLARAVESGMIRTDNGARPDPAARRAAAMALAAEMLDAIGRADLVLVAKETGETDATE